MQHNNKNHHAMASMLEQAYLEVIPTATILERLEHVPSEAYVSITCSPAKGLDPTLDLVDALRATAGAKPLKLVPHIAARLVRDKGHLREVLARLESARVESIFVPGGDAAKPAGIYADSLHLLRDMADIGHRIEDVGVTAHPEGHPLVNDEDLTWFLKQKQPFATYLVTQMCFDPEAVIRWLRRMRQAGITLPAWIGLPGVADLAKLVSLSLRIGVGQSVGLLKKQKGLVRRLVNTRPYQPDDLLEGLMPHIDDPELGIPGFHLFSFNDVSRTERWRVESIENLRR